MELSEALNHAQTMKNFFRAFEKLEEVLAEAQNTLQDSATRKRLADEALAELYAKQQAAENTINQINTAIKDGVARQNQRLNGLEEDFKARRAELEAFIGRRERDAQTAFDTAETSRRAEMEKINKEHTSLLETHEALKAQHQELSSAVEAIRKKLL